MVVPLLREYVMRKVAIIEDRFCILDVEKAVSLQICILWMGKLGI